MGARDASEAHLVSMTQPNLERSDLHHLRVGQAVRDTGQECALIKVAAHLEEGRGAGPQCGLHRQQVKPVQDSRRTSRRGHAPRGHRTPAISGSQA